MEKFLANLFAILMYVVLIGIVLMFVFFGYKLLQERLVSKKTETISFSYDNSEIDINLKVPKKVKKTEGIVSLPELGVKSFVLSDGKGMVMDVDISYSSDGVDLQKEIENKKNELKEEYEGYDLNFYGEDSHGFKFVAVTSKELYYDGTFREEHSYSFYYAYAEGNWLVSFSPGLGCDESQEVMKRMWYIAKSAKIEVKKL